MLYGIDVFSGAGGLSLGAEMAGIKISHAVEINPSAAKTFLRNHKGAEVHQGDIKDIKSSDLISSKYPVFVIMGGPPCQGFSLSNTRTRNMKNKKNFIFLEFVRLDKEIKPTWFVLENVWGLTNINEGKTKTMIENCFQELGYKVKSQEEAGINIEVEETGKTFKENATLKAEAIYNITHTPVLADDSGTEIDALNGEPGIYSARYMGEDTSYDIKNQNLIDRLDGVPDEKRTARFVCAIAAAFPDGSSEVVRGTMEGIIGYEIAGENGFGYDPIFYLPEYGCTSAQLAPEKKNELSHRGEGLRKMRKILEKKLESRER